LLGWSEAEPQVDHQYEESSARSVRQRKGRNLLTMNPLSRG